jgi:hypothetical protein
MELFIFARFHAREGKKAELATLLARQISRTPSSSWRARKRSSITPSM